MACVCMGSGDHSDPTCALGCTLQSMEADRGERVTCPIWLNLNPSEYCVIGNKGLQDFRLFEGKGSLTFMHVLKSFDGTWCCPDLPRNKSTQRSYIRLTGFKSDNDVIEALNSFNNHLFVSKVTHWYSRRIKERVEKVTEKVSLVPAHTQLDIRLTEGAVYTPTSSVVISIFRRQRQGAHLAFTLS